MTTPEPTHERQASLAQPTLVSPDNKRSPTVADRAPKFTYEGAYSLPKQAKNYDWKFVIIAAISAREMLFPGLM